MDGGLEYFEEVGTERGMQKTGDMERSRLMREKVYLGVKAPNGSRILS